MAPALELHHIWKKFRRGEFNDCLRDAIPALVKGMCGFGPKKDQLADKDFWALSDIDFKVEPGESLGIIGHNGAGKSTLLKILSDIIAPNRGYMKVNGRLRSLIEIGAGFHGDLTGRENIYLNGAILGMTHREIQKNFDSIVDFSGVEEFLDTPVKRYSSGMAARLGFAVAAHLEPDILIVDEVLSVGDAEFQKKCLGKMNDVTSDGRTVLFVSHNMAAVKSLCKRTILLRKGCMVADGRTEDVLNQYLSAQSTQAGIPISERTDREGTGKARVLDVRVGTSTETMSSECLATFNKPLHVRVRYQMDSQLQSPVVMIGVMDAEMSTIQQWSTRVANWVGVPQTGEGEVEFCISNLYVVPGDYSIYVCIGDVNGKSHDLIMRVASLSVNNSMDSKFDFTGRYFYRTISPFEWKQL